MCEPLRLEPGQTSEVKVTLPVDLILSLDKAAASLGVSRSRLLRALAQSYVDDAREGGG